MDFNTKKFDMVPDFVLSSLERKYNGTEHHKL